MPVKTHNSKNTHPASAFIPVTLTPATLAFWTLLCVSLALGIYARVRLFATSDPLGVNDDLMGTMAVWRDFVGRDLGPSPSNRIGEFGLSITLGVIATLFHLDPAHSISLLAFVCSLGLLAAAPFFVYSLGGGRFASVAFLGALALTPAAILETLTANSTSPFLFFAVLGSSFFILYWRRGGVFWIIAAVITFAFGMSIRGTGLLHLGPLWVTLVAGHFITPREQRAPSRRLIYASLGLAATVLLVSSAKGCINYRITSNYTQRDGHAPAHHSYFTYVLYDGIMGGPYGSNAEGWKMRERVRKDPALRSQDPLQRGDSALKIVSDHRARYVKNYFLGIWLTFKKSFAERRLNLLGWIPMLLGLIWLLARRKWFIALALCGWVSVYMLVQPLFAITDRTVWPIAFGLAAFGAFFFGFMIEWCSKLDKNPRLIKLRLAGITLVISLFGYLCGTTLVCAGTPRLDYRREARAHILDTPGHRTRLIAPSVTICTYGAPMQYVQMAPSRDKAAQERLIRSASADYVFFPGTDDPNWKPAYAVIKQVLSEDTKAHWAQVWSSGKAELWGKTIDEAAIPKDAKILLSIDAKTSAAQLKHNRMLTIAPETTGLALNCNGPDPIVFLPEFSAPQSASTMRVEIASPSTTTLKIFYKTDPSQDWSEQRAIYHPLAKGRNTLTLPLPPKITKLRLDPAETPGQYHLTKLVLFTKP